MDFKEFITFTILCTNLTHSSMSPNHFLCLLFLSALLASYLTLSPEKEIHITHPYTHTAHRVNLGITQSRKKINRSDYRLMFA